MNYLKTSRVVVIDDLPDEALPVIEAFGRVGIGCLYLRGERLEDLPKEPLRGVRLVVLDMRLGTIGGTKQTASMTANVFSRTISADEGPLIVLLWTKHREDIPAFKTALFNIEPKFRTTLLITDLEKPVTITPGTLRKITGKLNALARNWAPISLLWVWEQLAHDAATATTAIIAEQVANNANLGAEDGEEVRKDKWLLSLKRLLRTLAEAAGGRDAGVQSARSDLLETLIALNDDRLELSSAAANIQSLKVIFDQPCGVTRAQAAPLNGVVMIGSPAQRPQELRPGNVYTLGRNHGTFRPCRIDVRQLMAEVLVNFERDAAFKGHHDLVTKHKEDPKQAGPHKQAREKRRRELFDQCKAVVAEITPTCDFAQRSRQLVRLAGGVLVPEALDRLVPSVKESLRTFELIAIPGLEGLWKPVFSGRFFYTMPDPRRSLTRRPTFRLRPGVLADLRNWYASQSARPGYLSIPSRG